MFPQSPEARELPAKYDLYDSRCGESEGSPSGRSRPFGPVLLHTNKVYEAESIVQNY